MEYSTSPNTSRSQKESSIAFTNAQCALAIRAFAQKCPEEQCSPKGAQSEYSRVFNPYWGFATKWWVARGRCQYSDERVVSYSVPTHSH